MIYDVMDLLVYKRALDALHLIYKLERQIPPSHLKLATQLSSAAESVTANIAEGFAKRRSVKEWRRFLDISMGSSDEVITHTRAIQILARHNPRITLSLTDNVISEYKIISKQLNRLRIAWVDYQK